MIRRPPTSTLLPYTTHFRSVNPTTPTDSDAAANTVAEGAANGSLVGITAFSTDPNGPAVTFALSDDAGGRFAINATTAVVTTAERQSLDYIVCTLLLVKDKT